MKAGSRPQYYRIRRMVQMVREGAETGCLANSTDFMKEFEVSRRTVARDLDFLRDPPSPSTTPGPRFAQRRCAAP